MKVTVKYGFLPPIDKSEKICDMVNEVGKSCPLDPARNATISITRAVPGIGGHVRYTNLLNGEVHM